MLAPFFFSPNHAYKSGGTFQAIRSKSAADFYTL